MLDKIVALITILSGILMVIGVFRYPEVMVVRNGEASKTRSIVFVVAGILLVIMGTMALVYNDISAFKNLIIYK